MSYPLSRWLLSFTLPRTFGLVPSGRHQPCLHGCVLKVTGSTVQLEGPSREGVIEQALRFVRVHARKGIRVDSIAVSVSGPLGKDRGWITVNEGVSFSWGGVEPVLERGRVA